ncbi:hypothetical protein VTN00DRAFT_6483 [Thermoascus crustaceus]|uniref:uncharacterized protein n=1 Tax=Thermoascus crustaceus TaxID=5088 RepID=UPI003742BD2B
MASKVTVIVIGGSNAGIGVSHGLLKQIPTAKVILVNPSKDYYFNLASPRVIAKPDAFAFDKYLLPIADTFKQYPTESFEFVQGRVTAIDAERKTVTIERSAPSSSSRVSYDYLVIASGSTTPATLGQGSVKIPFKPNGAGDLRETIQEAQKTIADAKSIVIGGAGPVGVEFAGELAEALADKADTSITLISASEQVLPGLKKRAGKRAEKLLKAKGVKLLTGRKVEKAEQDYVSKKWTVTLEGGETITADVYVSATGVIPNNRFIPNVFLDQDGWVQVDERLHVLASIVDGNKCPVYAVGDITSHPYRYLSRISDQVPVVVANLKAEIMGQQKRATYQSSDKLMVIVPVGKSGGTGQLGSWVVLSFLAAFFKGRDFLVSKASSFIR